MGEEHADNEMIQQALAGELETNEEWVLQNIGRKKKYKSSHLFIQLPELNTALVPAFQDLDHTTRAATEMARCSKTAHKQAKTATELWQASEEQRLQDNQNLPQHQPAHPLNLFALPPLVSKPIKVSAQMEETNPPKLVDASTQTDEPTKSAQATMTVEVPTRNYDEEIVVQMIIAKKAKDRYEAAKVEAYQLRAQATKREAELQQLLDA